MRANVETKIASLSSYIAGLILMLVPFWTFISVWFASNFGYYTAARLVIEALFLLVFLGALSLLILDKKSARHLASKRWFWALVAIAVLEVIWGVVSHASNMSSLKAVGYAWIIDLRYPLFFASVYVLATKNNWLGENWTRLILYPALAVSLFAILQFAVLPLNFLTHFGYGFNTVFPYQTINHNDNFIRAMSFTRGANPLGAYMLIIMAASLALLAKSKAAKSRVFYSASLLLSTVALVFSFSRSAWLGAVLSTALLSWLLINNVKVRKIMLASAGVAVILIVLAFVGWHNNTRFQNYILHTQDNSIVKDSSNAGHASSLKRSFNELKSDPLGDGPGTAGPASVYNYDGHVRISEDYYLMFGLENGWLGLVLLLAFFVLIATELFRAKSDLARALFASFAGLFITNLLLPAWTDLTLAYIFWGLAGISLARYKPPATTKRG